jgi:hypothetical protein
MFALINQPTALGIGMVMLAAGIWLLLSSGKAFHAEAGRSQLDRGTGRAAVGGSLVILSVLFLAYGTYLGNPKTLFERLGLGNLYAGN